MADPIQSPQQIESERLVLSPLTEDDCTETYLSWLHDPEVNQWLATGSETTIRDMKKFVNEKKDDLFLGIRLKDSRKHIGNIKIDLYSGYHGVAEYGIMLGDKSEWGKGYAREASEAVLEYCFRQVGIRKIVLGVVGGNEGALDLYRRLGFVMEGTFVRHYRVGDAYFDLHRMGVFREDWLKAHGDQWKTTVIPRKEA